MTAFFQKAEASGRGRDHNSQRGNGTLFYVGKETDLAGESVRGTERVGVFTPKANCGGGEYQHVVLDLKK